MTQIKQSNKTTTQTLLKTLSLVALLSASSFALATGTGTTTPAGVTKTLNFVTMLRDNLYLIIGVAASIYLMYVLLQIKMEKKQWGDFGGAVFLVMVLGGVIILADFLWTYFTV